MSITAPDPSALSSPTFSLASHASSYDLLSLSSSLSNLSTVSINDPVSDDEIVWRTSASPSLNGDVPDSDDDFVVLTRPNRLSHSHPSTPSTVSRPQTPVDKLTWCLSSLTVKAESSAHVSTATPTTKTKRPSGAARRKKKKQVAAATATTAGAATDSTSSTSPQLNQSHPSVKPPAQSRKPRRRTRNTSKPAEDRVGLGSRAPVDDISERASDIGEPISLETAASYITRFLSDPLQSKGKSERLTLLQSLIIEFGLDMHHNALPTSLTAAKALLKAHAFINIREYLAVRSQGPTAVRNILFPTKNALIKDIKRNHNTAALGAVKNAGLQALLVPCRR